MIKNLLRWDPMGEVAVLVANGPSSVDSYAAAAGSICGFPHFIVGHHGLVWPGEAFAWVGLHTDKMADMFDERVGNGYPPIKLITPNPLPEYPAFVYKNQSWLGGSSSLYALELIRSIGYTKVHVFGVDLTEEYEVYRPYWKQVTGLKLIPHGDSLSWMEVV